MSENKSSISIIRLLLTTGACFQLSTWNSVETGIGMSKEGILSVCLCECVPFSKEVMMVMMMVTLMKMEET